MVFTAEDVEALAEAITNKRDEQRTSLGSEDPGIHRDHHEWIAIQIEKERRRDERNDKLRNTVVGAVVVATLGGLAKLGSLVWELMQKGMNSG